MEPEAVSVRELAERRDDLLTRLAKVRKQLPDAIEREYRDGATIPELADDSGLGYSGIRKLLKRRGVTLRLPHTHPRRDRTEEELARSLAGEYNLPGATIDSVADANGLPYDYTRKLLRSIEALRGPGRKAAP